MSKSPLDPTLATAGGAMPNPSLEPTRTSPTALVNAVLGILIVAAMVAFTGPLAIAGKIFSKFGFEGKSTTPNELVKTILQPATGVDTSDFSTLLTAAVAAVLLAAFLWALWGVGGMLTGGRGGMQRVIAAVAALIVLVAVLGLLA